MDLKDFRALVKKSKSSNCKHLFPLLFWLKIKFRISRICFKISLNVSTRVNVIFGKQNDERESQRLFSNLGPKKTDGWIRALCRVAAGVPLGERFGRTCENSLIQRGLGGITLENGEDKEENRTRAAISPSLSPSPSFSFYFALLVLLRRDFMQSAAFTVR